MIRRPPYADFLGLRIVETGVDTMVIMPSGDHVLGRPGFIHGGAITGLMEIAGMVAIGVALGDDGTTVKPVNVSVDFMRGGRLVDTYARGHVTRVGQRIANVAIEAWQDDPAKPIAAARMIMSLTRA
ncbi:PaaI family thioesterase [Sphingomonas sp. DBB INV C78]|uniref:PaaI family thioesterase n=1 Tax=Sphingomonas sp. DBB INV C78 TaxID=3349434 RepID=UPI0036D24968